MLKKDFWFDLPQELIAQEPCSPRDAARLMCLDRSNDQIQHRIFRDLVDLLEPGDLLVVNNSKVLPARLIGQKEHTGAVCELLLLRQESNDVWECLARPGKRLKPGMRILFGDSSLIATIQETKEDGNKLFFSVQHPRPFMKSWTSSARCRFLLILPSSWRIKVSTRPYTPRNWAVQRHPPTAGLHFTPELMQKLKEKGIGITEVTLHVGLGTFRPVKEDEIEDHLMHSEWYSVSEETARLINETKEAGHRVIAVGTTSCRTLESVAAKYGKIQACSGDTSIFLYPGCKFLCLDGLITNFHLPESTLIMLVSAFYGYDKTMAAYKTAVEQRYRFFSFGDAMLIL